MAAFPGNQLSREYLGEREENRRPGRCSGRLPYLRVSAEGRAEGGRHECSRGRSVRTTEIRSWLDLGGLEPDAARQGYGHLARSIFVEEWRRVIAAAIYWREGQFGLQVRHAHGNRAADQCDGSFGESGAQYRSEWSDHQPAGGTGGEGSEDGSSDGRSISAAESGECQALVALSDGRAVPL